MPEQEPLARAIGATRRRIKQAVGRCLEPIGLRPQRFWIVVDLHERPGPSLRELAERLAMDEPSASRIIAGLVRTRLVHTRHDPGDRRRCCLELAPEGVALARRVAPIAAAVRSAVEAGFTAAEKETFLRLLRRIDDNVKHLEGRLLEAAPQASGLRRGGETEDRERASHDDR